VTVFETIVGSFFAGALLAIVLSWRLSGRRRVGLAFAGPCLAIAIFIVGNPDAGCDYDCVGRLFWALVGASSIAGWWFALATVPLLRLALDRRRLDGRHK
jgi:hypothetical protein